MRPGSNAAQGSSRPVVVALPRFPRPDLLVLFLVAIVIRQGGERGEMLRALVREPSQQIRAVEGTSANAEIRRSHTAGAKLDSGRRVTAGASCRQRVPTRIEIGQKRSARFDSSIVAQLQLRRIRSACQSLEPSSDAGNELGRIAVACRLACFPRACRQ